MLALAALPQLAALDCFCTTTGISGSRTKPEVGCDYHGESFRWCWVAGGDTCSGSITELSWAGDAGWRRCSTTRSDECSRAIEVQGASGAQDNKAATTAAEDTKATVASTHDEDDDEAAGDSGDDEGQLTKGKTGGVSWKRSPSGSQLVMEGDAAGAGDASSSDFLGIPGSHTGESATGTKRRPPCAPRAGPRLPCTARACALAHSCFCVFLPPDGKHHKKFFKSFKGPLKSFKRHKNHPETIEEGVPLPPAGPVIKVRRRGTGRSRGARAGAFKLALPF